MLACSAHPARMWHQHTAAVEGRPLAQSLAYLVKTAWAPGQPSGGATGAWHLGPWGTTLLSVMAKLPANFARPGW